MDIPGHCMGHTNHHVSAMVLELRPLIRLRPWGIPGSGHGIVEPVPRDQVPTVHVIVMSDHRSSSRTSSRYRGWAVLLFK